MTVSKRLQEALTILSSKKSPALAPKAFKMIIWELMKTQSHLAALSKSVNNVQVAMDKKIHKITEAMKKAEADVKKGNRKGAVSTLKGAEKKNEKLVKEDKNVRDPLIKKCKEAAVKLPKNFGRVK